MTLLLRPWLHYRLVLDAHNEAIEPYLHRSSTILAITHWLIRRSDRVIVTSQQLAEIVVHGSGTPIVLPDPLPQPPGSSQAESQASNRFSVAVISTFAGDEPIDAIAEAARAAGDEFRFFITGNPDKLPDAILRKMPATMSLTGFLSEPDYWSLLESADAVIDLTTMDNCLVCGAYEAIAAGKPLVLSNNAASIATFRGFAEFTDNSPDDILFALMRVRANQAEMTSAIPRLRAEFEARWTTQAKILLTFIRCSSDSPYT